MGLFSGLYKPEVNEYIASRSKARQEGVSKSIALKPRQSALYSLYRAMTLLTGNTQEAERTIEIYFLREGQEGHAPLEESDGRS